MLAKSWKKAELEHVQSMFAIFTRSLRWKCHCFWSTGWGAYGIFMLNCKIMGRKKSNQETKRLKNVTPHITTRLRFYNGNICFSIIHVFWIIVQIKRCKALKPRSFQFAISRRVPAPQLRRATSGACWSSFRLLRAVIVGLVVLTR